MERLQLAISGAERALRPGGLTASTPSPPTTTAAAPPGWLAAVGQQLPRLLEALTAERTDAGDCSLTATAQRLALERTRLLSRLAQLAPALSEGRLSPGVNAEELRRTLLRLLHDIAHHHQRVNDLVYDVGWRDVGGSG